MNEKERCKGKTNAGESCQILAGESGFCRIHEPYHVDIRNEKLSGKELLTGCLPIALFPIALIIFMPIINGFVLSFLWKWFISPIFHIRNISFIEAMGIALIFHFLLQNKIFSDKNKKKDKDENKRKALIMLFSIIFIQTILSPLIVLLMGWIIHLLI